MVNIAAREWGKLYRRHQTQHRTRSLEQLLQVVGDACPACPTPTTKRRTPADLQAKAKAMVGSASGVDGVAALEVARMPLPFFELLDRMFRMWEATGRVSDQVLDVLVTLLPEGKWSFALAAATHCSGVHYLSSLGYS